MRRIERTQTLPLSCEVERLVSIDPQLKKRHIKADTIHTIENMTKQKKLVC